MDAKALIVLLGAVTLAVCTGCSESRSETTRSQVQSGVGSKNQRVPKELFAKTAGSPQEEAAAQSDRGGEIDPDEVASKGKEGPDKDSRRLELDPNQAMRLGLATTPVQPAHYAPSAEGFGVVMSHEVVAQALADLQSAAAAARLSEAALTRAKRLANGPGALGIDTLENAQRQQAADRAALQLAHRKVTSLLGVGFRWNNERSRELEKMADGTHQLVRVTFPPGSSVTTVPKVLRVSSLDASATSAWTTHVVWAAPQDPSLPGKSMFAVLADKNLAEGARVRAQAALDSDTPGVVVPETAVVINDGQDWCYVKRKGGVYERIAIDTDRPLNEGYFVAYGIAPGDEVVTAGAGSLLARQLNGSPEAAD